MNIYNPRRTKRPNLNPHYAKRCSTTVKGLPVYKFTVVKVELVDKGRVITVHRDILATHGHDAVRLVRDEAGTVVKHRTRFITYNTFGMRHTQTYNAGAVVRYVRRKHIQPALIPETA